MLEHAILSIPLHSLPHTLFGLTMILSSTVRQFRDLTCGDIEEEVKRAAPDA